MYVNCWKIHLKLSSNDCFRWWLSRPGWTSHSTEANKHSKAISRWTSDYQGNAILSSTGSQYMFYSKHVLVFLSPPKYIYFLLVSCWLFNRCRDCRGIIVIISLFIQHVLLTWYRFGLSHSENTCEHSFKQWSSLIGDSCGIWIKVETYICWQNTFALTRLTLPS